MRIYRDRLYFVMANRGISGFQVGAGVDCGITSGATVKSQYSMSQIGHCGKHGNLNAGKRFRLSDGHLPDYQPRATFDEASTWVLESPGRTAWIVD